MSPSVVQLLLCRLAYEELVGGVLNMRTEHFQRVNGYSNLYWGWGAEDDDMAYRFSILLLLGDEGRCVHLGGE